MQILHYEVNNKVGEGDMGSVYLAEDTRNGQPVAIKVLHKINMKSSMDRGAAAEVIEFTAGITHAALHPVLKVIDADEHGGILAVVMPPAAASVYDFMQRGKNISLKNAMSILEKMAGVLQNLHENEIAHGSVKPTNVLLDKKGNATLTDLAMAHLRSDMGMIPAEPTELQQHYTHIELMYHSTPEFAGDLFSLATMVFHLLTGRLPYSDPRPEVRTVERPSSDGLSPDLFAVLMRGMTHRKMIAYPDISAFMAELRRAVMGQSISKDTTRWFLTEQDNTDDDEL